MQNPLYCLASSYVTVDITLYPNIQYSLTVYHDMKIHINFNKKLKNKKSPIVYTIHSRLYHSKVLYHIYHIYHNYTIYPSSCYC